MFKSSRSQSGFTFIELAIVIMISSIFMVTLTQLAKSWRYKEQMDTTKERIADIKLAIAKYQARNNGHLPCPAKLYDTTTGGTLGIEYPSCLAGGGGVDPKELSARAKIGAVPAMTLGLGMQHMIDSWGNRFYYVASDNLTSAAAVVDTEVGAITLKGPGGNDIGLPDQTAYMVFSVGKGGNGGVSLEGKVTKSCDNHFPAEYQNCDMADSTFSSIAYSESKVAADSFKNIMSNALTDKTDLSVFCGNKGMMYGPEHPRADGDGCILSIEVDTTGNTTMTGNGNITGNATITGSATIGNGATITAGGANITGNTTVTGNTSVTGNTVVTGNSTVTGNTVISGSVGIGTTTPTAKLDVVGEIKVGNSGAACGSGNAGSMRYNPAAPSGTTTVQTMEFCDGTRWKTLAPDANCGTHLNGETWSEACPSGSSGTGATYACSNGTYVNLVYDCKRSCVVNGVTYAHGQTWSVPCTTAGSTGAHNWACNDGNATENNTCRVSSNLWAPNYGSCAHAWYPDCGTAYWFCIDHGYDGSDGCTVFKQAGDKILVCAPRWYAVQIGGGMALGNAFCYKNVP